MDFCNSDLSGLAPLFQGTAALDIDWKLSCPTADDGKVSSLARQSGQTKETRSEMRENGGWCGGKNGSMGAVMVFKILYIDYSASRSSVQCPGKYHGYRK